MMDLLETMMIAGICLVIGGFAFLLRTQLKALKQVRRQDIRLVGPHVGTRQDLYMGLLWSGIFLVQVSGLVRHIQPGPNNFPWFPLIAVASVLFVCGGYAGRLLLRWEITRREAFMAASSTQG
ncbi:MAG TPA: hypothetical protein VFI98_05710 [Pseudolabrys sp.]|jgi:hypothetical protein|nr:hypothetical protein [Pseudolabrys sp.]